MPTSTDLLARRPPPSSSSRIQLRESGRDPYNDFTPVLCSVATRRPHKDPSISEPRRHKPRVSLTKAQIQDGISAQLFSLCQGITADGRLSNDEIVALGLWLHDNRDADLPGIAFLSDTLNRIIADGRVTREGQRELMEAIERVLPPDARKTAKAARRAVEARRKADMIANRNEKRKQELESQQRRWAGDEFDFMVAGINFDGRYRIIERYLNVGDRVRLVPELDNPHDESPLPSP